MLAMALQHRLKELQVERLNAADVGLSADSSYMVDLEFEIAATSWAYVQAAVTEIATLRADLDGPLVG